MIATLLSLALLGSPKVIETVDSNSDHVVVQTFVPAVEKMSDLEQATWFVLADALLDGTEEFSRDRLAEFGSQAGLPVVIEPFYDFIKIQICEPKGGLGLACQLSESLILRSSLTDEAIQSSVKKLSQKRFGIWERAIWYEDLPFSRVTSASVKILYKIAFRPDRLIFSIGGAIADGEGVAQINKRFPDSKSTSIQRTRFDREPQPWTHQMESVSTFEWNIAPLNPMKPSDSAKLLAAFAFGVGKQSLMFRGLREDLGVSYRQETVLWPSSKGWKPRFVFAHAGSEDPFTIFENAKSKLTKLAAELKNDDLIRAKAMFRASLEGTNPLNPFVVSLNGSMDDTLESQCSFQGINSLSLPTKVDARDMIKNSENVTIEEFQVAAKSILDEAQGSIIPGR